MVGWSLLLRLFCCSNRGYCCCFCCCCCCCSPFSSRRRGRGRPGSGRSRQRSRRAYKSRKGVKAGRTLTFRAGNFFSSKIPYPKKKIPVSSVSLCHQAKARGRDVQLRECANCRKQTFSQLQITLVGSESLAQYVLKFPYTKKVPEMYSKSTIRSRGR